MHRIGRGENRMELKMKDGDYMADGAGGVLRLRGDQAALQRVLFRLTARREGFPLLPDMGSRLWQLGRVPPSRRLGAACQYVTEALKVEPGLSVEDVALSERGTGGLDVAVRLRLNGKAAVVSVSVEGG